MTQKFTAEEVREKAHGYSLRGDDRTAAMLNAYADTLSKPADSGLISAASNVLAADNWWKCNSDSPKSALNHYEAACADLRSAIRYRDEQESTGGGCGGDSGGDCLSSGRPQV